jgi:hypothetical protein
MDEPTPADIVHVAIEDLLLVVARAADDLRMFHATVSRARIAPLPPFPHASVAMTLRVIKNLHLVEQELRDVLIALGLPESPGA